VTVTTALPTVVLVGGAPGAGKTTLGKALAARLGATSLSVDDLVRAAQAVTTPDSHPDLHVMRQRPYLELYTETSAEELLRMAEREHRAAWPLAEAVLRKHVNVGEPIVLDGWHLRPEHVADSLGDAVRGVWIVCEPAVLEARERANSEWWSGSTDPERMLANFLGRSVGFNALVERQARERGLPILHQDGTVGVEALGELALATWAD
jgi:2-phosphoglycerate kinase